MTWRCTYLEGGPGHWHSHAGPQLEPKPVRPPTRREYQNGAYAAAASAGSARRPGLCLCRRSACRRSLRCDRQCAVQVLESLRAQSAVAATAAAPGVLAPQAAVGTIAGCCGRTARLAVQRHDQAWGSVAEPTGRSCACTALLATTGLAPAGRTALATATTATVAVTAVVIGFVHLQVVPKRHGVQHT